MRVRIILSIILAGLGTTAAILPSKSNSYLEKDSRQMLQEIQLADNYFNVDELADLIIKGDPSIRLIDIRSPEEYKKDALPGAINIPLDSMFTDNAQPLIDQLVMRNIFYSDRDQRSTQAWMILTQKGFKNNYILIGGVQAWKSTILNPPYPKSTEAQEAFDLYQQRVAASEFFTGKKAEPAQQPTKMLIPVQGRKKKKISGGCS